jgi:hypothetical protein
MLSGAMHFWDFEHAAQTSSLSERKDLSEYFSVLMAFCNIQTYIYAAKRAV